MLEFIFRRLQSMKNIPQPLGRWCIKDKSKNNWKIDMANVDHCGTCVYETQKPIPVIKEVKKEDSTSTL